MTRADLYTAALAHPKLKTTERHGVESSTRVLGIPADDLVAFAKEVRGYCLACSSDWENIVADSFTATLRGDDLINVDVGWFTGGEDLLRSGEGHRAVRFALSVLRKASEVK